MRLIVGLGNGFILQSSRHGVGAILVEDLATMLSVEWSLYPSLGAYVAMAPDAVLVWPLSLYNLSGYVVSRCARRFEIEAKNIVVVHDDIELKAGTVKCQRGGSHRGNRGVKSCETSMGTTFERLRVGVGPRPAERDWATVASFVSAPLPPHDLAAVRKAWSDTEIVAEFLRQL
jgi:PTH1 family peptidyl-tRNA hydrolase